MLAAFRQRIRRLADNRRGSALMLTMVFTFAMGGLAISAIYMSGSTTMLSKLYDRERDYRYAAEWALSVGKSQIVKDTSLHLPDSGYVQLMTSQGVIDAGGTPVPKVKVDLYAGIGGSSTGEYGQFVELVAVAFDNGGARHVRRLQLQAENFARYAMFTDQWPGVCYATGEIVRGRAHSNQNWVSCGGAPGPVYTDTVSAVTTISGTAQYQSAKLPTSNMIRFPTVARLAFMPGYASIANLNLTPTPFAGTRGGTRVEFVAVDLDGDGTLTGPAEGYFRVFDANSAAGNNPYVAAGAGTDSLFTRMSTPYNVRLDAFINGAASVNRSVIENQCGLNYVFDLQGSGMRDDTTFIPFAVHDSVKARFKWFKDSLEAQAGNWGGLAAARTRSHAWGSGVLASKVALAKSSGARCYPAGDPHLMPTERIGPIGAAPNDQLAAQDRRGGSDTTFTVTTRTGSWRPWPGFGGGFFTPGVTRRQAIEEPYLWPVHRTQNLNSRGVIYINGTVWLSGKFRGRATLYAAGTVKLIDDLTYVTNPASLPICQNLLGIITGNDLYISDTDLNRPRNVDGTGVANTRFFDDDQDFFLHAVTLNGVSKTTATFGVENYSGGPSIGRLCTPVPPYSAQTSGGCINQAGGVIERRITATFSGGYTGFAENRVKDACLDVDSPPYFPLTGRYKDNEFYEIDPNTFNMIGVGNFYRRLQSG
ncbi:MAG: hypothetical protein MNPFHGCM_01278 [Gemmatimonadaceae bacterium]|nr:hypothetical protein [Gemmatimonadaceae bacterium]